MRQFNHRAGADCNDEHYRMSETVSNEALHEFCSIVISNFGEEYFNRCSAEEEKKRCLDAIKKEVSKVILALRIISILLRIVAFSAK